MGPPRDGRRPVGDRAASWARARAWAGAGAAREQGQGDNALTDSCQDIAHCHVIGISLSTFTPSHRHASDDEVIFAGPKNEKFKIAKEMGLI